MKRISLILPVLLALSSCKMQGPDLPYEAYYYTNPVLHLDYSDPDVCQAGDGYYMTASSFNCFPGLPVLYSQDLVHWKLVGSALADYDSSFRDAVRHGEGVWAPAIRYHDGWFYIFVGDPDRGIFMVRTQDPSGPWEKPVWLVREKGFIDPCPLWASDGSAWLSHGCAGSRAGLKSVLFVAPMASDGSALLGPSRIVYDGHLSQPTIEGTKFYQRGEWYYIFAPAGGVATGWQTVLRSRSVYGPYEERVVMAWAPSTINGPHQGAWVTDAEGAHWFLHFQDKGAYGRIVHLQPMRWLPDGWPLIGEDPDGDGVGQPVSTWKLPVAVHSTERVPSGWPYGLGLEWQYPAVPGPYYHMALPDGGVRLYSVLQSGSGLWNCPNLLQQKFPAESFCVTARLLFRPNPQLKQRGESAGFVVMGENYAGFKLVDTEEGALFQYITCTNASKGSAEVSQFLAALPYSLRAVDNRYASGNVPPVSYPDSREAECWVKMEVFPDFLSQGVPDAICQFSWSLDGENYTPVPRSFTAAPGRWIGAKFGFFCNRSTPKNDSGSLDVLDLKISIPES